AMLPITWFRRPSAPANTRNLRCPVGASRERGPSTAAAPAGALLTAAGGSVGSAPTEWDSTASDQTTGAQRASTLTFREPSGRLNLYRRIPDRVNAFALAIPHRPRGVRSAIPVGKAVIAARRIQSSEPWCCPT